MSYTRLLYHIVFRTKHSIPAIMHEHEAELYAYLWGLIKNKKSVLYRVGGMPDHLHLLLDLHPEIALSDFVRILKNSSGKWLRANPHFPAFESWGEKYAAFSCNLMEKDRLINYIKNQRTHHEQVSFADEFRQFILENGGVIDERYFLRD